MIKKLLNHFALKAIQHRRYSLESFKDVCQKHMEKHKNSPDKDKKFSEYANWERMYWDAWVREEELSSLEDYLTGGNKEIYE